MQHQRQTVTGLVSGVLFALLISNAQPYKLSNKFRGVKSWKALDFAYESPKDRASAMENGSFIYGNPMPIDIDVANGFERRIFITIPRFGPGVPATLGYVTDDFSAEGNPIIAPFPTWVWQRPGYCNGLTSVWRIEIDRCGRLWVMDTGKIEETQVCPPQLLSFSLDNYQLLSRYKIPKEQYSESSLFVTPVVDVRGDTCQDTFVYIADVTGFAIVVYDHQNVRSWRISNNLFFPYPNYGTFSIKNDVFDLMDGILGMALSPLTNNQDRTLYFHSLASKTESYVATSVIRNYTLFNENSEASPRSFVAFANERSSQSAAEAMDKNGVLYFGLMSDLAIGCWNSRNYNFGNEFIEKIAVDPETLQFASGVKVITATGGRQVLWIITVAFQRVMTGTMNSNETNFRIQAAGINDLIRGTKCDVASLNSNSISQPGNHAQRATLTFPG